MCSGTFHGMLQSWKWLVSSPDPVSRGKGGLVNIVQHFCALLNWCGNYLTISLGFLTTNHLPIFITPVQTYLAHLQFAEAHANNFKGIAFSIATASPWCEAVLYLPHLPFIFGGGSGYETRKCFFVRHDQIGCQQLSTIISEQSEHCWTLLLCVMFVVCYFPTLILPIPLLVGLCE